MSRSNRTPYLTAQRHRSNIRGRLGFTLVELLVVIGIIATLLALLVPALARAREQARTVACAARIHEIGVAALLYCNRNQGYLPVPVLGANLMGGLPESAIWGTTQQGILDFTQGTLIPDLGGTAAAQELFQCPSDPEPRHLSAYFTTTDTRNFSYVFNSEVVDRYESGRGYTSKRITRVRRPARKALIYENADTPSINSAPVAYQPTMYPGARLIIALRHHDRSNVFYADGHVDLFESMILKNDSVATIFDNMNWVTSFQFESE